MKEPPWGKEYSKKSVRKSLGATVGKRSTTIHGPSSLCASEMTEDMRCAISDRSQTNVESKAEEKRANLQEMNEIVREGWSPVRHCVADIVENVAFEIVLIVALIVNVVVLVMQVNHEATCVGNGFEVCATDLMLTLVGNLLLALYCLEMALKVYVLRRSYSRSPWNIFDCLLIMISLLAELADGIPGISFLRIFKVARLGKFFHIMLDIPALYMMVKGFVGAMVTIFWASVLSAVIILLWSIVSVAAIHPVVVQILAEDTVFEDCRRCPHAFASVSSASLTLIQTVICGDSWGLLALPVIDHTPWCDCRSLRRQATPLDRLPLRSGVVLLQGFYRPELNGRYHLLGRRHVHHVLAKPIERMVYRSME